MSGDETGTLRAVLDEIIPPSGDGRLPGAGELGLAEGLRERAADLWPVLAPALEAQGAAFEPYSTLHDVVAVLDARFG